MFDTAAKVGKAVGISHRTVENWAAQGLIEKGEGGYSLVGAFQCRIKRLEDELAKSKERKDVATDLKERKLLAECRKEEAIANLKELELQKVEGQLVAAAEIVSEWENFVMRCRAKLLAMPSRLALELSGIEDAAEIERLLRLAVDEALEELSN